MILKLKEPYRKVNEDWIFQNGVWFSWSESNCCYEYAWWLYPEAADCPLGRTLRKERTLPEGETL